MTDGDIAVELVGASKRFRQRQPSERVRDVVRNLLRPKFRVVEALTDVSFRAEIGEIVAYAGPNGAGKSTTIKMLSGMLAPDSGTVRVLGLDPLTHRTQCMARTAVVFGQRTELWADHPVAASFEWKRVVWDIPRARYVRTLAELKALLGLGDFWNSVVRELSLGQRMRADLALALVAEPDLLFLDEPTLGLDVLAKRDVLAFIKDWNRERALTVIITSHDMAELEQLAGRIVMIDKGRIAFDGSFDRLRTEFGDTRRLLLETASEQAPALHGIEWMSSNGCRHEFRFDAAQTPVADLMLEASRQGRLVDVETHRASIDDVIADIYERWKAVPKAER